MEGERSGLFYEALRIIDELKPTWAIWENVPGLLSSDGGRDLARVMFSMVEHGYSGCYRLLDSQWFGVAQRRRRLFGVFARGDSGAERAAKVLSLTEGLRGHPAPERTPGKDTARGADGCAEVSGTLDRKSCSANRSCQGNETSFLTAIADTAHAEKGENGKGWNDSGMAYTLDTRATQGVCAPTSAKIWPAEVAPTLNAQFGDKQGLEDQHALNGAGLFVPTVMAHRQGIAEVTEDICPTVKWGVRRLTPMECERLQGFPDDWTASLSDAQRYKALGNAVTVNVAEWIAKRLIKEMENYDQAGT